MTPKILSARSAASSVLISGLSATLLQENLSPATTTTGSMETTEKLLFTTTPMLEIFTYSFMVRAFIAGIVIGIVAPLIGTFLVARRFSLIADTLGHISLAGIALGLLLGINPIVTALIASILTAVLVDKIRHNKYISGESALAMLLSGGLALAIVLMGLARGFNVDLLSFLFGSISTV